jgi:hypothetical protein
MRRIDVQDELKEGFEVSPLPAVGPDGAPSLPPLRTIAPPRPRLCEAGPCRNYHRFEIQIEAADPRARTVPVALPEGTPGAQAVPGGTVYQAPAAFHVETHHYCYPTPGVEMPLGALPVIQCNRWDPYLPTGDLVHENQRAYAGSAAGLRYEAEVRAWVEARDRELDDAREAEELIAQSLRVSGDPTPEGDPR